jgi:DHA1 family bicyclomycin/chloramphenicol resistance-like MFS transporter
MEGFMNQTIIPPRRLIGILALLTAFGPLATDTYLPALDDKRASVGGSASGVAASLSVFFFGLALGQLIYGPISDRYGRRGPMLVGTGLFVVASGLACMVTRIDVFIALRLLQALGGACGLTLARAVVRDLYDAQDLTRAFAALTLIGMIAPLVAPTLGVGIMMVAGWRAIFGVMFAMGLVTFAAILFALPETLPPERRHAEITPASVARGFVRLLARRRFALTAMVSGGAAGVLFSFITGSAGAFMAGYGLGKPAYTAVFTGVTVAMTLGGMLNRRLVRRHAGDAVLAGALNVNVVMGGALMLSVPWGPWAVAGCLALCVMMLGLILPNSTSAALASLHKDAGSASSVLGVIQFGTGFCASSIVAWGQNGTAWPMALGIAGCAVWARLCWAMRGA